jgi:hypothetical protein
VCVLCCGDLMMSVLIWWFEVKTVSVVTVMD